MPVPPFYDPQRVGVLYRPDVTGAAQAGNAARLSPAAEDRRRIMLLLVDAQVDFVHPQGALSVPGAVDDTQRTIEWLLENAGKVSTVAASLDSHIPTQIFFPTWWDDADGQHPQPFTPIALDDVRSGRWRPVYEPEWSVHYVETLEAQAKKQLMIWPYHTLLGSEGHNLMPALYEAVVYHSAARQTQPLFIIKGLIPRSEHYSILEPEVKVPDHPQGTLNREFLSQLETHDRVYIAGQAKSHCVLETMLSLARHFSDRPDQLDKLYLLLDCTSSVAHPEIDFDALANQTLAELAQRGIHLVRSTDPV
ncbi:MAG: nicotinamidase [Aggregatilineales bacterium]